MGSLMKNDIVASVVQYQIGQFTERAHNLQHLLEVIEAEAKKNTQLVVFPEMCITGFFSHDPNGLRRYWDEGTIELDGPELQALSAATKKHGLHVVVGFAERGEQVGVIHNSAALIGPDGIIGVTRKIHFPTLEKLYYTAGDTIDVFDCDLGRIGMVICYDAMFPEYTRELFHQGVEVIVFTSSMWRGGNKGGVGIDGPKRDFWKQLALVTAVQNQAFVVSANGCGCQNMGSLAGTWERLGISQIVAPTGEVLQCATESETTVLTATLPFAKLVEARTSYRFITDAMVD